MVDDRQRPYLAGLTELEVAHRALRAAGSGVTPRERDPGHALIGGGRPALEAAAGYRAGLGTASARLVAAAGIRGYIVGVALLAAILLAWPVISLARAGGGVWTLGVLAACGFLLAVDAAMALVNGSITSRLGAKVLPALELPGGVPESLRTLVVVPTILSSRRTLAEHLEHLEIHHLASPDGDLCFALLSDWADAPAERVEGDEALLDAALAGVARLNRQYGPAPAGDRFLFALPAAAQNLPFGVVLNWQSELK